MHLNVTQSNDSFSFCLLFRIFDKIQVNQKMNIVSWLVSYSIEKSEWNERKQQRKKWFEEEMMKERL